MFRALVLSIVLTVAAGPNAPLLCRTWCDQQTAASGHHHTPTASSNVAGDDSCDNVPLSATAWLREDAGRGVSPSGGGHLIPIARYQLAQSMTDARLAQEPGREWWLESRPLDTALRI